MRYSFGLILLCFLIGCKSPSKANIELRKQNAELSDQVAELQRQHDADLATMKSLEAGRNTVETLPAERLDNLFTTTGLSLGKLTGPARVNPASGGPDSLRIIATPTDATGQTLKAAGSFTIELFDLALPDNQRIGQWQIPVADAKKQWISTGLINAYVFQLPWQTKPEHDRLTIKVTFGDELTGRKFVAERIVGG